MSGYGKPHVTKGSWIGKPSNRKRRTYYRTYRRDGLVEYRFTAVAPSVRRAHRRRRNEIARASRKANR